MEGWPGAALALLRITVGLSAIAQGANSFVTPRGAALQWTVGLLEILAGVLLLLGFITPIVGACLATGNAIAGIVCLHTSGGGARETAVATVYLVVMSIVLALVGPGSYSLDARLFGRREIIIPTASSPLDS